MKLTIERGEKEKGMIFKKIVFSLKTVVELTPEEGELIRKHKWDKEFLDEAT